MSFTETQLIHRLSQSPSITSGSTTTYILTNGMESEDKGLIMKLDAKLGDSIKPMNTAAGRTISSQNCGLSPLSGWTLRALSYFQKAHMDFLSFANKINETAQKKVVHILPLILYLSLLVLGVQGVVIMMLLTQSLLPLGMWFLMTCISTMGGIFCFTAVITEPNSPNQRKIYVN